MYITIFIFIKCSISVGVMLANLDFYLKLLRGLGVLVGYIHTACIFEAKRQLYTVCVCKLWSLYIDNVVMQKHVKA